MTATLIDGRKLARDLRARILEEVIQAHDAGVHPGFATLLIGDDYAAIAYEQRLRRLAESVGCRFVAERLPPTSTTRTPWPRSAS